MKTNYEYQIDQATLSFSYLDYPDLVSAYTAKRSGKLVISYAAIKLLHLVKIAVS